MSLYQDHEGMGRGPQPTTREAEHPSDEKRRLARINGEHKCRHDFSDGDVCSRCDAMRGGS